MTKHSRRNDERVFAIRATFIFCANDESVKSGLDIALARHASVATNP
jgi:hypothetical protein